MITPEVAAKAFTETASTKGVDAAVAGLVAALKNRGALSLLPRVVAVLERMRSQSAARGVRVYVAKKTDAAKAQAFAKAEFGSEGVLTVDQTVIGGFLVQKGGEQYDATYKAALVRLYRSIIS